MACHCPRAEGRSDTGTGFQPQRSATRLKILGFVLLQESELGGWLDSSAMRSRSLALALCVFPFWAHAAGTEDGDLLAPLTPSATHTKRHPAQRTSPAKAASPRMSPSTDLVVRLSEPIEGAHVFVDEREVGELPMGPFPVDPGTHVVRVSRAGFRDFVQLVKVLRGHRSEVSAQLESAIVAAPSNTGNEAPMPRPNLERPPAMVPAARELPPAALPQVSADRLASPRSGAISSTDTPFFSRWYVWVVISAVAAGAAAGGWAMATQSRPSPSPTQVCSGNCDAVVNGKLAHP
jgi:hypothetical protein